MSIFSEWPYQWVGFWRRPDEDLAAPTMEELVDQTWNPPDKERLIAYLAQAPVAVVAGIPDILVCKLCGEAIGNPSCYMSDDYWLWPCNLAHFVKCHSIRLPDRMVKYIEERNYIPPTSLKLPHTKLPWPNLKRVAPPAAK